MTGSPRNLLATVRGGRVIDVATGSGTFVSTLVDGLQSWTEIVGIDADPGGAEPFADAFGGIDGVRFEVMDALRPRYPPASFDTASVSNSLHHFARPTTLLRRMMNLLVDGGRLVVSEMYRDGQSPTQQTHVALHHWCAEVDRLDGTVHRPTYTRRQIVAMLERLNLDDLRTDDIADTASDPKDAATTRAVDGAIERYLHKADGHPQLVRRGKEIRHQLQSIGIHGATTFLAVGRKRPARDPRGGRGAQRVSTDPARS